MHAVRIGDSVPAPQFSIVAKPNSWTRSVLAPATGSADTLPLSEVAISNIEFWDQFHKAAIAAGAPLRRVERPLKNTNYWVPIATRGDAYLSVYRSHARKPSVGAFVGLYNAPLTFVSERLLAQKDTIEAAYGEPIEWSRNREGVVTKAWTKMPVLDANDRTDWPRQHAWMVDQLIRMEQVFGPIIADALAQYSADAPEQ